MGLGYWIPGRARGGGKTLTSKGLISFWQFRKRRMISMIRINQLKLNIKHSEADLKEKILKTLCISEDSLLSYED